jgi:hypothetical protein
VTTNSTPPIATDRPRAEATAEARAARAIGKATKATPKAKATDAAKVVAKAGRAMRKAKAVDAVKAIRAGNVTGVTETVEGNRTEAVDMVTATKCGYHRRRCTVPYATGTTHLAGAIYSKHEDATCNKEGGGMGGHSINDCIAEQRLLQLALLFISYISTEMRRS